MEQRPSWEANSFSASQEIPAFYGTRRFITAFTRARHLSLSWASSIQFMSSHPTSRIQPHITRQLKYISTHAFHIYCLICVKFCTWDLRIYCSHKLLVCQFRKNWGTEGRTLPTGVKKVTLSQVSVNHMTFWKHESKESLSKVRVQWHGGHHLQFSFPIHVNTLSGSLCVSLYTLHCACPSSLHSPHKQTCTQHAGPVV
jgi:hypothetical protein